MRSWDDRPVALAVRGSRLITVDGTVYRWRMRRNPTYTQECLGSPLTFAVELTGARGTVLVVTVPDVSHPASLVADSSLIVRPALVAAVIRTALGHGWEPAAPGAPFRLSMASGDLPAEAKTGMIPGNPWRRL
jgi:hypothetical protein